MRSLVGVSAAAAAAVAAQTLQPLAFTPLKLGQVMPAGWMKNELDIQASGLAGYMDEFYEPVNNTQWLGGTSTHEDWTEIFPYVLDGYVPQAILTQRADQLAKVEKWLNFILATAERQNGWLGPNIPGNDAGMVYWPRWPILLSMFQWYEYTGNTTMITASLTWLHEAQTRVNANNPGIGYEWTGVRMQDWIFIMQYLIDLAGQPGSPVPSSEVPFLFSFMTQLQGLGQKVQDWENNWWVDGKFPTEAVRDCTLTNHGVNQGQAVKSGATLYRIAGDPLGYQSSYRRMQLLDTYHGVPTGVFQADEHLAGNMPSHGTETCTVVELMWSYNIIHETFGDSIFAERSEKIAYNALPGSMTKDMWARVYLQQMNEPVSVIQNNHVWISDGPAAIIYSLEGNYACCTSNFPQGWPKFVARMVHTVPVTQDAFVVSLLGPVTATLPNGAHLSVAGDYPFEDVLTFTVTSAPGVTSPTPLHVRIPSWSTSGTLSVNGGSPISVSDYAGTVYRVPLPPTITGAATYTVVFNTNPAIRVDYWFNGTVAVHRGALVYALQLGEVFSTLQHYAFNSSDYAIVQPSNTTIPWNAALVLDPTSPESYLTFERAGPTPSVPYSSQEHSVLIKGKAVAVNTWGYAQDGSAAPPPASPVDCSAPGACGQPIDVVLVPYGTTHLRMTEMPYTLPSSASSKA